MTSFCNHFGEYSKHKSPKEAFELIKFKHGIVKNKFTIPINDWIDTKFRVESQTDMKKNLGISILSITNKMKLWYGVNHSHSVTWKQNKFSGSVSLDKSFLDDKINVSASSSISDEGVTMPSINVSTSKLYEDIDLSFGIDMGSGMFDTNITRQVGNISYGLGARTDGETLTISPKFVFSFWNGLQLNLFGGISSDGNIDTNIGMTYKFSKRSHIHIFLSSSWKEWDTLSHNCMIV